MGFVDILEFDCTFCDHFVDYEFERRRIRGRFAIDGYGLFLRFGFVCFDDGAALGDEVFDLLGHGVFYIIPFNDIVALDCDKIS